jgi:anti-anti-sigma regulatory factor
MYSSPPAYDLHAEEFGPIAVIRLRPFPVKCPDSDRDLRRCILHALEKWVRPQLVLNLAAFSSLDVSFVGELIILQNRLRSLNGCVLLCGLHPQVCASFKRFDVGGLFTIFRHEADAVRALVFANNWLLGADLPIILVPAAAEQSGVREDAASVVSRTPHLVAT